MKQAIKLSLIALGAAMVTQALQAQQSDGELILGFNSSAGDYVIDLGQVPTSVNTQLGGAVNMGLYTTTFSGGAANVGVVGGDQDGVIDPTGGETSWVTTLRRGTAATSFGVAGTESAPNGQVTGAVDSMAQLALSVQLGVTGLSTAQNTAWNQIIVQSPTQNGTSPLNLGTYANPMTALTGVTTLDLWSVTDDNGFNQFTYQGDIQVDMTGSSPSVVFDPTVAAVPEPTTLALLGGGGMLMLGLRRRASLRKN